MNNSNKLDYCVMLDVRFGSLAAVHHATSLTAAFGGKADIRFEQKWIFNSPLSARSGRSRNARVSHHTRAASCIFGKLIIHPDELDLDRACHADRT